MEPLEEDCLRTDYIICPYCGYQDKDSWEFGSLDQEEILECPECEKDFFALGESEYYYYTRKK